MLKCLSKLKYLIFISYGMVLYTIQYVIQNGIGNK